MREKKIDAKPTEHFQAKNPKEAERQLLISNRLSLQTFFTRLSPRRCATFNGEAKVKKTQSQRQRNIFLKKLATQTTEHFQARSTKEAEGDNTIFFQRQSLQTFFTRLSPRRGHTLCGEARVMKTQSQRHRKFFL